MQVPGERAVETNAGQLKAQYAETCDEVWVLVWMGIWVAALAVLLPALI